MKSMLGFLAVNRRGFYRPTEIPGPAFRRWAVRRWAAASDGLSVAVVARTEHICPEKTGLLIAAEEGMHARVTDSEPEASAWLDSLRTPKAMSRNA